MEYKKIIPCLDVKNGKVCKGVGFENIREVGDVTELAKEYEKQGADEITLLDITATLEDRETFTEILRKTASAVNVPIAIGGGIKAIEDFERLFEAGASKVSVNSAAVKNPSLVKQASEKFGKEKIIVAIDVAKGENGKYTVIINGGTTDTGKDAIQWAKEVESLGAGEILLTSQTADGTKNGYDIDITKAIADAVAIPVTASGGCGKLEDFKEVFEKTNVSSALAASMFHFKETTVGKVKEYLKQNGVAVR
ncbi:MAG: imidazole glycerol phosphate synthase subunit HisF [Oscillospiraceae bacterium]